LRPKFRAHRKLLTALNLQPALKNLKIYRFRIFSQARKSRVVTGPVGPLQDLTGHT